MSEEERQIEGEVLSPEEEVQHALAVIEKYKKSKSTSVADSYHFDSSNHPQQQQEIVIRPNQQKGLTTPNAELLDKIQNILSEPENVEALVEAGGSGLLYRLLAEVGVTGGIAGAISGAVSGIVSEKLVGSKKKRQKRKYQQQYYREHQIGGQYPNQQLPYNDVERNNTGQQNVNGRDSFDV